VKFRQNPPSRIGQIRQKSARNWDDFRPFFTLRVVFVGFLVRILPYLRSGQGKIFIFFENILHNFARKSEKKSCVLLIETQKPPESASQIQKNTKLVKSARNPPEIGSPPEIFFARQTTFKSARIVQIWRRKPPSGNAASLPFSSLYFTSVPRLVMCQEEVERTRLTCSHN
jgi:hypothetical protein